MKNSARPPLQRQGAAILLVGERAIFFLIGIMLFAAAMTLLVRAVGVLWLLIASPAASTIAAGSAFLDIILLVLMVVELAYTVMLSLRGVVLSAEPFLIVGLIAVIRRILVITVGEVRGDSGGPSTLAQGSAIELAILTSVVLAFVISITLLRWRPRSEHTEGIE
ncbi:MAG: hypothetical protein NVSMB5_16500 [Candidatus Velthaea sp.]